LVGSYFQTIYPKILDIRHLWSVIYFIALYGSFRPHFPIFWILDSYTFSEDKVELINICKNTLLNWTFKWDHMEIIFFIFVLILSNPMSMISQHFFFWVKKHRSAQKERFFIVRAMESSLKVKKDQYNWTPCTNLLRLATFNIKKILF